MSVAASKTNGRARGPRVPLVAATAPPAPAAEQIVEPSTPNLDAAVLRVQAGAPNLIANMPGQVQSRTYNYVDLKAVVAAVLPLLVEEDLLWKVMPSVDETGRPALRYSMTHIPSGERDEDTMPLLLAEAHMQGLGSAITYGRRYALVAYLNLTVDQDDDGQGASGPPAPTTSRTQPSAAPPRPSAREASPSQQKMLRAKARAAGLSQVQLANAILAVIGEPIRESEDQEAAGRFVDLKLSHLPARLVDALIAEIASQGAGGGDVAPF